MLKVRETHRLEKLD